MPISIFEVYRCCEGPGWKDLPYVLNGRHRHHYCFHQGSRDEKRNDLSLYDNRVINGMVNNVMASSIYVYLLVSIYQKMEWGFKGQGVITVNRLWELGKSLIFSVTISVMLPRSLFVGLFSLLRARRISAFDGIDDGGFDGEAFLRVGQIAHRLFVILDHSHLLIENVNVVFLGSVFPPHLQL